MGEPSLELTPQTAALAGAADALESAGLEHWFFGGWAVDLWVGRLTRAHDDIDVLVQRADEAGVDAALTAAGWVHTPRDDDLVGTEYAGDGYALQLTFVETDDAGPGRRTGAGTPDRGVRRTAGPRPPPARAPPRPRADAGEDARGQGRRAARRGGRREGPGGPRRAPGRRRDEVSRTLAGLGLGATTAARVRDVAPGRPDRGPQPPHVSAGPGARHRRAGSSRPGRRATPADVVGPLFTDHGRRAGRACGARPPQG